MATKNKVVEAKIGQLVPDDKNLNKHTEFGTSLLEKSVTKFGLGRSILLDKNNRIIAGNGITETAGANGLEDVIIVETTGDKLVAVKRTDIDLDSKEGRELALADNATANANLSWDVPNMEAVTAEFDISPQDWGIPTLSDEDEDEKEDDGKKESSTKLIVECGDVSKLSSLFSELQKRGFVCELKE